MTIASKKALLFSIWKDKPNPQPNIVFPRKQIIILYIKTKGPIYIYKKKDYEETQRNQLKLEPKKKKRRRSLPESWL
jgi:hypothetical protein